MSDYDRDKVQAIQRDASWWPRPNTRNPKRWHVLVNDFNPACGARMLPNYDDAVPATSVAEVSRCQRPGCRQEWQRLDFTSVTRNDPQ